MQMIPFFLQDSQSNVHLVKTLKTFSLSLGLKPNLTKCDLPGIGVLEGIQWALCCMKYIDLRMKL